MKTKLRVRNLLYALFLVLLSLAGHTQTYKPLVFENFGPGTADPSAPPAANITPGITDYTAQTTRSTLSDGRYAVALNPLGYDNFGSVTNAWQHGGDHTTGSGYMMLINANPARQGEANGSYYLYSTSFLDVPGAEYVIDFWGANVIAYDANTRFGFTFKNGFIGVAVRNTPNATGTLYNSTGVRQWVLPRAMGNQNYLPWVNQSVTFSLPLDYNSPTLYFNFYNSDTNPSAVGNDLAIDDIVIRMRVWQVSGFVFNDVNGNTVADPGETGINGETIPMFVYLTKSDGTIIGKVQASADGSYSFAGDQGGPFVNGDTGMKIIAPAQDLLVGASITSPTFPARYVATGQNVNGASGATTSGATGIINLTSTASDMANLNFGIDQLPTAQGSTAPTVDNPTGTNNSGDISGLFGGSDPNGEQ